MTKLPAASVRSHTRDHAAYCTRASDAGQYPGALGAARCISSRLTSFPPRRPRRVSLRRSRSRIDGEWPLPFENSILGPPLSSGSIGCYQALGGERLMAIKVAVLGINLGKNR